MTTYIAGDGGGLGIPIGNYQSGVMPYNNAYGIAPGNFQAQTNYGQSGTADWLKPFQSAATDAQSSAYNFLGNTIGSAENFQYSSFAAQNSNLYGLLNKQTDYGNALAKQEADALTKASNSIAHGSRGGMLGFLGF